MIHDGVAIEDKIQVDLLRITYFGVLEIKAK